MSQLTHQLAQRIMAGYLMLGLKGYTIQGQAYFIANSLK